MSICSAAWRNLAWMSIVIALLQPASRAAEPKTPPWTGNGNYRVIVDVDPVDIGRANPTRCLRRLKFMWLTC